MLSPISFDASTFEVWGALLHGGRCVLYPERIPTVRELGRAIAEHGVDTLWLNASLFNMVIDEDPLVLASVRQLLIGGEALSVWHVRKALALLPETRIVNGYGPTESTTFACCYPIPRELGEAVPAISIGKPIGNTAVYILDAHLEPVPVGVPGKLHLGGHGLARDYLNRPGLTAEKFIPDPFGQEPGARLYKTGDLARYLPDGNIEFLGRLDHQVKIRGFRIELGEIETALGQHPAVREAVVLARADVPGDPSTSSGADKRLMAYVVPHPGEQPVPGAMREFLRRQLPEYMLPSAFVTLTSLPLTPNGKIDRGALPAPQDARPDDTAFVAPQSETERAIAAVWQEVLHLDAVGVNDNFFELGGHSLLLIQVHGKLREALGREVPIVELFQYPTISSLASHLSGERDRLPCIKGKGRAKTRQELTAHKEPGVAVIGLAGRFPGAGDVEGFWRNLCAGVESVTFFTDAELLSAGADPAALRNPNYVKAAAILDDVESFDAAFFGLNPREAEIMDPQHRIFLECAWEALEKAGYDPENYHGSIGVYAGTRMNTYLLNLLRDRELMESQGGFVALLGNDKDFLPTRVSYKLNLRGPSINVQTACSTSLVAVHLACQSLLHGECDIALAGGVAIKVPQKAGYLYQAGGILSPDGHCRAFDAKAHGTVSGNGVGVVVLKRLTDAVADGDHIHAVIKGTAINNDGAMKVGYTAPSVDGQAEVITEALAVAGISPETVGYIETHGTGTELGDPIEIAALTQAFRADTEKKGFCALGSVKTNIGHLDAAAGVTGLIKTVLALEHKLLPPSLHYEQPNPEIDFAHSPFYVNTALSEWKAGAAPRRAGVSAFGIGGTNAHVVLEEAPNSQASGPSRPWQLLALSAKTSAALETATANLRAHLEAHPDLNLADAAHTLLRGRKTFAYRRVIVCRDPPTPRGRWPPRRRGQSPVSMRPANGRRVHVSGAGRAICGHGLRAVPMRTGLSRRTRSMRRAASTPSRSGSTRRPLCGEARPARANLPGAAGALRNRIRPGQAMDEMGHTARSHDRAQRR